MKLIGTILTVSMFSIPISFAIFLRKYFKIPLLWGFTIITSMIMATCVQSKTHEQTT